MLITAISLDDVVSIDESMTDVATRRSGYDEFRRSPRDPSTIRHADLERWLRELSDAAAGRLTVERFAESYQRRPIYLATIGSGPRRVLLWSQMHGDEPTHTAVLIDLLSYLTGRPSEPMAAEIQEHCTLHMLPMLNPDGAEAVTRFNAQGIDVNRDSSRLATPEGRALRRAVDTLRPQFAFNLHNQSARAAVGAPPRPVVLAVLAPLLDVAGTDTPQLRAAKQIAVSLVAAVRPRIEGLVSRYAAEYMPNAFGEAVQAAGAATVLVEAGGWPGVDPTPLVDLHFDALLAALRAIATESYRDVDPAGYDALPTQNAAPLFDCVVAGGHVIDPQTKSHWRADVAINHSHGTRLHVEPKPDGVIVDVGDLAGTGAKLTIEASGCLILPGRRPENPGRLEFDDRRGSLTRGSTADLLIFDGSGVDDPTEAIDTRRLKRVIVAGETVWADGEAVDKTVAPPTTRSTEAADA
jgi:hypothetical protein